MPRLLLVSGLYAMVAGCASQAVTTALAPTPQALACGARLAQVSGVANTALDASGFDLVNWNIRKGSDLAWVDDLQSAHPDPDLVMLQEAVPGDRLWEALLPGHFRSFAQGFRVGSRVSGVMTMSTAQPLTECRLVAFEPWLGTSKATLVTAYALTGTAERLLVVNVHGINFTFGTGALGAQLHQVQAIIAQHRGPVLLSGDFNTWHDRRAAVLQQMVASLGLVALEYDQDHRKRVFGQALDHIYVRGLEPVRATTMDFGSSDHDPMIAQLRLARSSGGLDLRH